MATIRPEQLKRLLDSGLSMAEVQNIASSRGDTVPGPTILGELVQAGIIKPAVRFGQAVGSLAAQAFGATPEQIERGANQSTVFKVPLLGTMAVESQKALGSKRGNEQLTGQTLEAAGTFFPVGRAAGAGATVLSKALPSAVAKPLASATSLGVSGYGIESGYQAQRGEEGAFTPGLGTAIPAAIPLIGPSLRTSASAVRSVYSKASGINPDTITTILTNPKGLEEAQKSGINKLTLGNLIEQRVSQLSDELSETGSVYDKIRATKQAVRFAENPTLKILNKFNIGLEDGQLVLGPEAPALSQGDITALERFISQYGLETELSTNGFLNARKALSNLSKFDQTKTDFSSQIARLLRREYDEVGKAQIPSLKSADEQYAPTIKELSEIKKEYLAFKDGEWVLKDTALSKITNAGNKGREKVLERLEKYVPGISQQIQMVKALENISDAQGIKVGAYLQSILLGGGAYLLGSNPVLAAVAAVVALPQLSVPMLLAFGKVAGISRSVLRTMVGKIVEGRKLSEQELLILKNSVINHLNEISPGDQFFASPLGKRTAAFAVNPKAGLSIDDVSKGIPKELEGLAQEARKYKSAEEFVKAQKTGDIPSGTYDSTTKSLSENTLLSKENNPVVVGKIGKYEIRESGKINQYAKVDKNGEIVRSADGKAVYLSPNEIKVKGLAEKDHTLVVFDGDKPVGYVMDSFGSPEISVAKEYQRQGIGSDLLKRWMQKFPNKKIGQMTPEGEAMVKSQLTDIWEKAVGKNKE